MIQNVYNSNSSPNTAIDAIQTIFRQSAREDNLVLDNTNINTNCTNNLEQTNIINVNSSRNLEQTNTVININSSISIDQTNINTSNNLNTLTESTLHRMVTDPAYGEISTTFNSISDLTIYNAENVPMPNPYLIDLEKYNHFIQFLEPEDAIIAAYYLSIPPLI